MYQLWVEKHKPEDLKGFLGNPKAVGDSLDFLRNFKPGRALFFHGHTGTGKTLLAELLARESGFELTAINASESRSQQSMEPLFDRAGRSRPLFHRGRLILLDEVDGISGQERGAVPAILKLIKESRFPVIIVANNPWKPKLAPLRSRSRMVRFSKIMTPTIEKRLKGICKEENLGFEDAALKSLARFAQGDLRSAITDLQLACLGKKILKEADLQSLGFRERDSTMFQTLPSLFHSRNIQASRKLISDSDRDPEEVLLWLESNAWQEIPKPKLADAFGLLAKADLFRGRISKQQNWRFKAYMSDLMAGISLTKGELHMPGFRPVQRPSRIDMLGRSRASRAIRQSLLLKVGSRLHCSARKAHTEYLPYLKIIFRKGVPEGLELEENEERMVLS